MALCLCTGACSALALEARVVAGVGGHMPSSVGGLVIIPPPSPWPPWQGQGARDGLQGPGPILLLHSLCEEH